MNMGIKNVAIISNKIYSLHVNWIFGVNAKSKGGNSE